MNEPSRNSFLRKLRKNLQHNQANLLLLTLSTSWKKKNILPYMLSKSFFKVLHEYKERKQTHSTFFIKIREKQEKRHDSKVKRKESAFLFFFLLPHYWPSTLLTGGPTSNTRQLGKETEAIHPHSLLFQAICSHFTNPTKMSHVRGKKQGKTRKNGQVPSSQVNWTWLDFLLTCLLPLPFHSTILSSADSRIMEKGGKWTCERRHSHIETELQFIPFFLRLHFIHHQNKWKKKKSRRVVIYTPHSNICR